MNHDQRTFTGGAFDAALPDGRSGAELTLLADRVRAICVGGRVLEIPYRELRIEVGGASGAMVMLRGTGADPMLHAEDALLLPALRNAAGGRLDEVIDGWIGTRRRTWQWSMGGWLAAALLLVALGVGLWWGIGWGFNRAIAELPISVDRQLGDAAAERESLGEPLAHPLPQQAVELMVALLSPHAAPHAVGSQHGEQPGFEWRVQVVLNPKPNAFALPGGRIVVWSGLIAAAERPEQVLGVLGHEMAHVTCRHGVRQVARSLGALTMVSLVLGDVGSVGTLLAQGATMAILTGYSRDMEREADAEGARLLAAAGSDPRGLIDFFALLQRDPETQSAAGMSWLSSHPQHAERIANLETLIPTLPRGPAATLNLDWAAVRAAASAAVETVP